MQIGSIQTLTIFDAQFITDSTQHYAVIYTTEHSATRIRHPTINTLYHAHSIYDFYLCFRSTAKNPPDTEGD